MPGVGALRHEQVREALRLLGVGEPSAQRATALRQLRELLSGYGTVRGALERAPQGARTAFVRLVQDGAAPVEDLLGRGWWGRGMLPPPLDWLQRRSLVLVGEDGRVHASDEARKGFADMTLDLEERSSPTDVETLRVEKAGCVVIARDAALLNRAVGVAVAGLRAVSPTVALSLREPKAVAAALRSAGIRLENDAVLVARPGEPALPGTTEDAVGPRAVRALVERALSERRQLHLRYFASSRGGAATERVVDPWSFRDDLLVGYCHLRTGERTFAVDRIGHARLLATSIEVPPASA